ncbi:MAG: hypothetical protein DMF56_20720 [Acidobacteria bacterium]|nr:MAG: hypothetical protein DMF56_20720 [Acidobacteriota bacterium]
MKTLWKLVRLKPSGQNLCAPKADIWLLLLRLNIAVIVLAEGLAWGYIGWLMAAQTVPVVGGLLVGGVVVILVGSIDSAFAMLDLSRVRDRKSTSKDDGSMPTWRDRALRLVRQFGTRARVGVIVRIAMVVASLMISAPFLAQIMFSTDIRNARAADYAGAVAQKRATLVADFERQIAVARQKREDAMASYSSEIAGTGLSRRYGSGPVARSLEQAVAGANNLLDSLEHERAATLKAFDNADESTRAKQFGVDARPDGIAARFEALGRMEAIPGFRRAENAIRMVLFGLFLGLLLLKWYEPRALEIYYDEELQDAYELYRAGYYDEWYEKEMLAPEKMTPFEFRRWYYETEGVRARTAARRAKIASINARMSEIEATVNRLRDSPGADMAVLTQAREERDQELQVADKKVQELQDLSAEVAAEVGRCQDQLRGAAQTIAQEDGFADSAVLIRKRKMWEERLTAAINRQRRHGDALQEAIRIRALRQADVERIDEMIRVHNELMGELANAVSDARKTALRDLKDLA